MELNMYLAKILWNLGVKVNRHFVKKSDIFIWTA